MRYTEELKAKVVEDYVSGDCPTMVALRKKHGASVNMIRKWVRDPAILKAWADQQGDSPLPERYRVAMEKAEEAHPELWQPVDRIADFPRWGQAIAELSATYLPPRAKALLHPTKIQLLLQGFALGTPAWACWGMIGITTEKAADWRHKATKNEEPYASLFMAILSAKSMGVHSKIGVVADSYEDKKDPKGHIFILKHRHRADFHTQEVVETKVATRPFEEVSDERLGELASLSD